MVGLFVFSASLPGVGLFGVYCSATAEQREHAAVPPATDDAEGVSYAHVDVQFRLVHERVRGARVFALRDLLLIGGGLLLGTVFSVWAVVDTALA